ETGDEATLRQALLAGDVTMVLVIPESFDDTTQGTDITVYVDASQVRLLGFIMPALQKTLLDLERKLRHTEPLFNLDVKDVKARSQRYLDFLLPGILAFTLMQVSIAGSGFNIVEYRRKGILKRLFVTPIRPAEFIAAICLARLAWCLMQLTVLILVAVFLLKVTILGNFASLYFVMVLGAIIFLCAGFCVGSVSRTQQGVGAVGNIVIFPQLFLSGVFFPISVMPDVVQPVAHALPLSFVVNALRGIANDGASLVDLWPQLAGICVWMVIAFVLATRLFSWKEVVR
ncbi:MAG: ABC transporter permease, partial [Pseudomonadales bacterium]|nr:ABC transporter permease [Pseudomonadales bacterium]